MADVAAAEATRALVEVAGQKFYAAVVDVTSPEATLQFAAEVAEVLSPVAALVNNAGIYPWKSFEDTDLATRKKVMAINLDGPFLMTKAFLPVMRVRKNGRIVNVASTTFWMNAPEMTAYIASKGGVIHFTCALVAGIGTDGVTANVIAPVLTNTPAMKGFNQEIFDYLPKMQAIPR